MRLKINRLAVFAAGISFVVVLFCSASPENGNSGLRYREPVVYALQKINLTLSDLSLPKLGIPYSTPARQKAVDYAMQTPLWMIDTGAGISHLYREGGSLIPYQTELLADLGYSVSALSSHDLDEDEIYISNLESINISPVEKKRLHELIVRLAGIARHYQEQHPGPTVAARESVSKHIKQLIADSSPFPANRQLSLDEYHRMGEGFSVGQEASYLLQALREIEKFIESANLQIDKPVSWDTPLGKIRIAANTDDAHYGHFFLLIDSGGSDSYHNVGITPPETGFTFVIDLSGNDRVSWDDTPGPGAGVFGIGIWADKSGDDVYRGRNVGIGVGLFGAGAFWDAAGNDSYESGSLSQGAGQYGIGIAIDVKGNDHFSAEFSSQGYAGTGGLGILINHHGNDVYRCGNTIPDQAEARIRRHSDQHYLSMCQGYSFGLKPDISGGVGLLIDHAGDDVYEADIFAQGSSYWFGLGMLIDSSGNDTYSAYEHAQGESLHLGAGFLGDYGGNDSYTAYEHAQGVGVDRAIGILLDKKGNDNYYAVMDSQAAGIKPFGFGILIDSAGNDSYSSRLRSQGYSKTLPKRFPRQQWPAGVLLDLDGKDTFSQPGTDPVTRDGRVQNRRGIAIDYTAGSGQQAN